MFVPAKPSIFSIPVERANIADERREAGYPAKQQMVGPATVGMESKPSLGDSAHQQLVPGAQFVKLGGEFALWYQLKEEFDFIFVRRRDDRIGPFEAFGRTFDSERGVLPGG